MRILGEAIGCRCKSGTMTRQVRLADDGTRLDNPPWECHHCGRTRQEPDPNRAAPTWPAGEWGAHHGRLVTIPRWE